MERKAAPGRDGEAAVAPGGDASADPPAAAAATARKKEPTPENFEDIFSDVDEWALVQGALWAFGIYARFKGILNEGYREAAGARVEVVTPITDFARIREGSFLWTFGSSPYAGDTLHQSPLVLALLSPLAGRCGPCVCMPLSFRPYCWMQPLTRASRQSPSRMDALLLLRRLATFDGSHDSRHRARVRRQRGGEGGLLLGRSGGG